MTLFFEAEVERALQALQRGEILLYPTDTVWGLGCDATAEAAVKKIYALKERTDSKSLIILLADARDLLHYVAAPDPAVFNFIETAEKPTTLVFENAINLPDSLVAPDGSVAIRITKDVFCRHLIKRLRRPLVSTSANKSRMPTPQTFAQISGAIKSGVDHIVAWRQEETAAAQPSRIIKWEANGTITVLRP